MRRQRLASLFTIFHLRRPSRPRHSPQFPLPSRISCGRSAVPYSDEPSPAALRASAEIDLGFRGAQGASPRHRPPAPLSRTGAVAPPPVFFPAQPPLPPPHPAPLSH